MKAVCAAALWGIDTVLMGTIGAMTIFNRNEALFIAAFVTAFFHDAFSAMWTFLYLSYKKQVKNLIKAVKTKSAFFVVLAALLGGPVGMSGYLLAINLIGPSYTAIISSIYPALGAVLSYFFLKERINRKAWMGLLCAIAGVIILGYTPEHSSISAVGFLCAFICVIGWGSECVICSYGMRDETVNSQFALQIRQFTSAVTYGVMVIPFIGAAGLTFQVLKDNALFWLCGTALSGTMSYLCYYNAIYKIGPTKAMGINVTYVIWSIILDKIFLNHTINMAQDIKTFFCALLVISGVYFVVKE